MGRAAVVADGALKSGTLPAQILPLSSNPSTSSVSVLHSSLTDSSVQPITLVRKAALYLYLPSRSCVYG